MKYKASDLIEHVTVLADITCSNCYDVSVIECCDESDSAYEFFSKGWRSTRIGNVYCPVCANKKLKGV